MTQANAEREPANWEITAVALQCDYIDDLVTVRVNRDWVAECAWCFRYKLKKSEERQQKIDATIRGKIDKCIGPDCPIVTKYRDQLIEEEFGKK